jgi:Uma2 family endonuclease
MAESAKKKATYEDLYGIPENMIGEIINGELIVHPRPSRKHARATYVLGHKIGAPYDFGEGGGSGGWIFLQEPEIQLDEDTMVPDLAGWKKERFPPEEDHNWISVAPDWVCEVLSPKTLRTDKIKKMPIYAQCGVGHIWLVDPIAMTLDAFRSESGRWFLSASFCENDKVRAEPFQEVEFDLGDLWLSF